MIRTYRDRGPLIAADAWVAPTAVLIGAVEIAPRANVWFGSVLRGDLAPIFVGATNIQDGTIVHVSGQIPEGTRIGADVTIGHMCLIHACTLEDGCFIGMKACVMDGAVVESGAWVAAGALVTPGKRVKSGDLWAGTPARLLRAVSADEKVYMERLPGHYAKLADEYR